LRFILCEEGKPEVGGGNMKPKVGD